MNETHKRCVLCAVELETPTSTDALVHVCPVCAPSVQQFVELGKTIVVSSVRQRMQRELPTLFAAMQILWRRSRGEQREESSP